MPIVNFRQFMVRLKIEQRNLSHKIKMLKENKEREFKSQPTYIRTFRDRKHSLKPNHHLQHRIKTHCQAISLYQLVIKENRMQRCD